MGWRFENGTYVVVNGCTNPPFTSVTYPDIPITTATLSYTLPAGICGSGTGLVDYYVSGMIDLAAPCADVIYTPPSALSLEVACPAIIDPAGPFCSNGAPYTLTASNMPGGTWSGTGITNSTLGTFDPSVAGPGTWVITYNVGCPGVSTLSLIHI